MENQGGPTLREELLQASLRAVYAGKKYLLAVESAIGCYQNGEVDTPGNADLVEHYWSEWHAATDEAVALNERLATEEG